MKKKTDDKKQWERRYKEWLAEQGMKSNASGLNVFKALTAKQEKAKKSLVSGLKKQFDSIDRILREQPGQVS